MMRPARAKRLRMERLFLPRRARTAAPREAPPLGLGNPPLHVSLRFIRHGQAA
jgi:hypothetical protein